MFIDTCYYVMENIGDRRMVCVVIHMDLIDFIEEYRQRFDRVPLIYNQIAITEEEAYDLAAIVNNPDVTFNGDE
jgi:hypothetical protein